MRLICRDKGAKKQKNAEEKDEFQRVLRVVLEGIGISSVAAPHFALRLLTGLAPSTSSKF